MSNCQLPEYTLQNTKKLFFLFKKNFNASQRIKTMLFFTYLPGTNSFLISNLPNLSVTSSPLDLGTVTGNWIGCIFSCCN